MHPSVDCLLWYSSRDVLHELPLHALRLTPSGVRVAVKRKETPEQAAQRALREERHRLREATFFAMLGVADLPVPETEYRFWPERKFRFDYAWPEKHLALEVEGGIFMAGGGRHNRGAGYTKDLEKYSMAAALGWRILRVVPSKLAKPETIALILKAFWWTP